MNRRSLIFTAVVVLIIGAAAFGIYNYNSGADFKLLGEARALEAKGDIKAAHEKIVEALKINPTNKKALVYKTRLYNTLQNSSFLENAAKNRDDALRAMNRGDYVLAAEKLDAALEDVFQVSPSYGGYERAEDFQRQLLKDTERLLKEAPEKYYLQAVNYFHNGEYERAYYSLDYILKPDAKVLSFKDNLAFRIGAEKYNECVNAANPTAFLLRDGIMWLSRVSGQSKEAMRAAGMIKNLNSMLSKAEKKR